LKIVFITHYFPPLNSSGARRINAFAKYLSEWGHEVTVVTTKKSARDGFLTESIPSYLRLLEINNFGQISASDVNKKTSLDFSKSVETRSWLGRVLLKSKRAVMKVFGQLIDHRLIFAVQFASPLLAFDVKNVLKEADIVMTSCPPWPMHLAGWLVKKRFQKCWVADYRDQFSGNHILVGSCISRRIEELIDRMLLKSSDCVTVVSNPMKDYYKQFHPSVVCIENGYDQSIFDQARLGFDNENFLVSNDVTIRYMGTISADRIPEIFFQALIKINEISSKRVIIEFYGESALLRKILNDLNPNLDLYVKFKPQLSYIDSIKAMLSADALFFIETSDLSSHSSRGILTTKLFEYLAAKKPIIAEIKKGSLASEYIEVSGLGLVVSCKLSDMMLGLMSLIDNSFLLDINEEFIKSLSRRIKTRELEQLFNRLNIT
jgi:glycosyltransferase involved in cell wall biosynthesis